MELLPDGWFGFVALELDEGLEELDEDDGGVLLEPAPAEPLGLEELGALLDEDEDEPPLAWSFLLMSIEVDEEFEPEGVLGVLVVPPAEDEDEEPGEVVAPEGEVEDELDERSAPRSHAAISDAPSARETATAMVESLMWPPWLGYKDQQQISGRDCYVATRIPGSDQFFIVGFVSLLRGPVPSPRCWKSRCCAPDLGSTWP